MPALIPLGFWAASGAGGSGAANPAYELISTTVLGTAAASVTFSGLGTSAAAYKHLQIRMTARGASAVAEVAAQIRLNSDSGSNYAFHYLLGNGSGAFSGASTSSTNMAFYGMASNSATASAFGAAVIDLLDFASTSKNKTVRALTGVGSTKVGLSSGLWVNTSAIDSILIYPEGSTNWVTGSRFSLYGLR